LTLPTAIVRRLCSRGKLFFGARVSVGGSVGVSVGGWFFLFATELATEIGFTDDCYTDGHDPSVTPSVLLLPTEFIDVTDGISPSAKLYNVVVYIDIGIFNKT
jgi:hypothetical protein